MEDPTEWLSWKKALGGVLHIVSYSGGYHEGALQKMQCRLHWMGSTVGVQCRHSFSGDTRRWCL